MKRTKLIEYTLIVIAAIFGYKFFEGIFTLLVQTIAGFDTFGLDISNITLQLLLLSGGYLFLFVVLVRKSRAIAIYLNGNNADEVVPLKIGKKALLQLIIIGICVSILLNALPELLEYLYESLKNRSEYDSYNAYKNVKKGLLVSSIIRFVTAVIVIITSKEIVQWFLKNDGKDELILEAEAKDENANG
jgi:hypothetical protein